MSERLGVLSGTFGSGYRRLSQAADPVLDEAGRVSPKGVTGRAWVPKTKTKTGPESKPCFDARGDDFDLIDVGECEEEMSSGCLDKCEEEQVTCNIYEKDKLCAFFLAKWLKHHQIIHCRGRILFCQQKHRGVIKKMVG